MLFFCWNNEVALLFPFYVTLCKFQFPPALISCMLFRWNGLFWRKMWMLISKHKFQIEIELELRQKAKKKKYDFVDLKIWENPSTPYYNNSVQSECLNWAMPGFRLRFTSFSGHRPAQRECAWTALRSHASCHPYPIPQPGKVGHTTEVYDPYSFQIVMCVLLCPTRTNQWKCCEMGPTVFHPYLRRLESLTIYRCHYKGSTFFSVL